jgi:hypothetical protein
VLESLLTRNLRQEEYAVLIAWNGPQDKPYYRALLVSASLAEAVRGNPFVKAAAIAADELRRVEGVHTVDVMRELRNALSSTHQTELADAFLRLAITPDQR